MPSYDYVCDDCAYKIELTHPADDKSQKWCPKCRGYLKKRFPVPAVNWGGLKPSDGKRPDGVQELLDTASERRDIFEERHDQHERAN